MNPISVAGSKDRTTSPEESIHSVLGKSAPKHPPFFQWMDYIKLHEFDQTLQMWSLMNGDSKPELRRKYEIARDLQIKIHGEKLDSKQISVGEFLNAMSDENILPRKGLV